MIADFAIRSAGDATWLVEFADRLDAQVNARAVWVADAVRRAGVTGVRDVVPAYRSVAVYYDPLRTDGTQLRATLESAAAASRHAPVPAVQARDVPVCYGGPHGPDLEDLSRHTGLTADQIVAIHCAPIYRVFMIGFTPGFAYLGPVDPRIAVPRRATPRLRVPAGSVGIAGPQTGIYPSETPGGWVLVGRTPFRPFQPAGPEPFLLKAGDAVRFVPIDDAQYRRLAVPKGAE